MGKSPNDDDEKVVFWQTKTEEEEGVGTDEKGTFERSLPQQNKKVVTGPEKGKHTYYDPRNRRSGETTPDEDSEDSE